MKYISKRSGSSTSFIVFLSYLIIYMLSLVFFYENKSWKLEGAVYWLWVIYPLTLLLFVQLRWGINRFHIFIVPFLLMSIAFYWLSIFLLDIFSSYQLTTYTYFVSLIGISTPILAYFFLDLIAPSPFSNKFESIRTRLFTFVTTHAKTVNILIRLSIFTSLFFTILFFLKAGGIPLLADNPELARVEAMKGAGLIHRLSYLPLQMAAIMIGIVLAFSKPTDNTRKKAIFSIILLVSVVLLNMLTGPRASPLWALIYLYISYELLRYQKVRIRQGFLIILSILLLVAIMGGIRYSGVENVNLKDTMGRFINRVYMNPVNADRIIQTFEDTSLGENSFWIDLAVLKPGFQPDLGTVLKEEVGAKYDGGGITVPLPAEGYMNYGLFGVWVYAIGFAFLLKIAEYLIYFIPNILMKTILMIITPLQLMGVVTMGISGIIVKTIIPSAVVALGLYFILIALTSLNILSIGKKIHEK